jgi:hypothetical protein
MPGFDRTGPMGQGSQTGRRMGRCNPSNETQMENFPRGRGFGRRLQRGFTSKRGMGMRLGLGYGFGYRHGFQNQNLEKITEVSEKTIIENEINTLKNQLSLLEDKLSKTKGE